MESRSCKTCKWSPAWFKLRHRDYVLCENPNRSELVKDKRTYPTNRPNTLAFELCYDLPCWERKESEQ